MAEPLSHLKIDGFFSSKEYLYPRDAGGGGLTKIVERNRAIHGKHIADQLESIKEQFDIRSEEELPSNIVRDDAIYVEFFSEPGFALDFNRFNHDVIHPEFQLLNIKSETVEDNGERNERYRVVVMMLEGGISSFIEKVDKYISENTKNRLREDTGKPVNLSLIANIQNIQLATLRSFWTDEPEIPFPKEDVLLWWEVWFRRTNNESSIARVTENLAAIEAVVGVQTLEFPEHIVKLVKATAIQLSQSLMLLDNLAELRKPQQINDFITGPSVDMDSKREWLDDLNNRTTAEINERSVLICLLDTGVSNRHPLLTRFLPDERLYAYNTNWGTEDSCEPGGHGTGMAGLALYGDLTVALSEAGNITIFHSLESFKIVHPSVVTDPSLYGVVTEYACSAPQVDNPFSPRVFCLSVTDRSRAFKGRPSNWSASIDKIAFGINNDGESQLIIVSGGNVNYMLPTVNSSHYPSYNYIESIHDPGQSYNALTVGSYTRMDRIDQNLWPGAFPLASNGGMSPSNSTSMTWDHQWPVKPDIVMEGGNLARRGVSLMDNVHTLKPLSLDKDFVNYLFYPLGDTSCAAALTSKLAAELKTAYPDFRAETVKGLIVHSADWTPEMLNGKSLVTATIPEKRSLLRTYGYGVPNKEKAFYSARNSLTLIAENTIQPYKLVGSIVKTNEFHLYEIPWPTDVLQNYLADRDVTLKVTLSYFIQPNPGERRYANNFSYHSHSLDFKMIRPTENINEFKRRISKSEENRDTAFNGREEPWTLKEDVRNRGSIKKDFLVCSGADLALRNIVAIYPKGGWYRTRKRLGFAETRVRYSLIVSIETPFVRADLYTPVLQLIDIVLPSQ